MRLIGRIALPILLACPAFAQTQFEVASIRPSAPIGPGGKVDVGLHIDGAQVRCISWSLRDYLARAYRTKVTMISGPDWTVSERFDILATLPAGGTPAQVPEMLQALLTERFQVKLHREKKDLPVYVLLTGKDPLKLKESPVDPNADADRDEPKGTTNATASGSEAGVGVNLGHGSSYSFANNSFTATKLTMAQFTTQLERYADRPIVDMTGLSGQYDFALQFTPEDYRSMLMRVAISAGVSLPPEAMRLIDSTSGGAALGDAMQQIGLKLEARKAPLDVLIIDEALKTPTAN
jgi:uncharacterized protein (TIGR03435 family)